MVKFSKKLMTRHVKQCAQQSALKRGRALEEFAQYVFSRVPGVSLEANNALNEKRSQEVDLAFWNDRAPKGFHFLPDVILVECKNLSSPMASIDLNWFDGKMERSALNHGFVVSTHGISGDMQLKTGAYDLLFTALGKGRRIIVFDTNEMAQLTSTEQFVRAIKRKICQLTVYGAYRPSKEEISVSQGD